MAETKTKTRTIATSMEKGFFTVKSKVVIHKENSRAEDKVYECGKVEVERYGDDQYIVSFTTKNSSFGVSSRGTLNSRTYSKSRSFVVDEVRRMDWKN